LEKGLKDINMFNFNELRGKFSRENG